MNIEIPVKDPNPDFDSVAKVIGSLKKPDRVYIAELLIDEEVKKIIIERYFRGKNVPNCKYYLHI